MMLLDKLLGRGETEPEAPPPPARGPEAAERALRAAIASKLLQAWVTNRQQVRVPLTLNLARMEPEHAGLVVAVMEAALAACGVALDARRARLDAALARIGGGAGHGPEMDLPALLAAVHAAGLGPHAYAAAALVLDRRIAVERLFLEWLAARFDLPPDLTAGLARRYRGLR